MLELDEEMKEVLKDFLQESYENLDRVDSELIELEEQPNNRDLLSSIFRSIHTIKGTCGFFGFDKLEKVTHIGENLLVKLRDGEFSITEDIANGLLAMVDAVRAMLDEISGNGHDGRQRYSALIEQLSELKDHGKVLHENTSAAATPAATADVAIEPGVHVFMPDDEVVNGKADQKPAVDATSPGQEKPADLPAPSAIKYDQPGAEAADKAPSNVLEASIRVDVPVLDALMNLVGELVLARNQIVEYVGNHENTQVVAAATEQRIAAGKPAEGVLLLRAFHEGGQVHIEISDDGGGIPPDRIKRKAIEKGVISTEQAANMSDLEICRLVFLPGLSTAEKVTNISGRGVGMDVVKTNIEKISGAIDLDSVVGRGTIFKIRVPLTLAIVPALIVSTGMQRFAIPQVNLIELIRIDEEAQPRAIEYIHGCPVHRLRGQLLPLVYLHKELKLATPEPGALNIVILQAEKCRFGLVVDQINDTQEIVVKPLAEALKNIPVFAGATIMGDGRVALILDTMGIGQRARVMSEGLDRTAGLAASGGSEKSGKSETLLLVSMASNGRLAIPLNRVARLEQFDIKQTEIVGNTSVVQYRGQILPLVQLSEYLHERRSGYAGEELYQVVVFGDEGRLEAGTAYIAPGDFHMVLERVNGYDFIRLNKNPLENSCRPSVDPLFRSAAAIHGSRCLGVVMTCMGQDGLNGSKALYAAGATIIVQDEASSVVWGMPKLVAQAGLAEEQVRLDRMAKAVLQRVRSVSGAGRSRMTGSLPGAARASAYGQKKSGGHGS